MTYEIVGGSTLLLGALVVGIGYRKDDAPVIALGLGLMLSGLILLGYFIDDPYGSD